MSLVQILGRKALLYRKYVYSYDSPPTTEPNFTKFLEKSHDTLKECHELTWITWIDTNYIITWNGPKYWSVTKSKVDHHQTHMAHVWNNIDKWSITSLPLNEGTVGAPTCCLRPDSKAAAEGLGRRICPPSLIRLDFTKLQPRKSQWHIMTWLTLMTWSDMTLGVGQLKSDLSDAILLTLQ
jgi:hypothetical protein